MTLKFDQINSIERASLVVSKIVELGCQDVCLCPGGRNAPFVEVLSKTSEVRTKTFFDERSAAFFALGKIKKDHKPVAVITTSGTAVAELLPAVIEAYYSNLPLIVISADRPKRLRQSGSPQTIDQVNIFGKYTPDQLDLSDNFKAIDSFGFTKSQPLHLNVCFEEPLLPLNSTCDAYEFKKNKEVESSPMNFESRQLDKNLLESLKGENTGLVVVGSLEKNEVEAVKDFLVQSQWPVYL